MAEGRLDNERFKNSFQSIKEAFNRQDWEKVIKDGTPLLIQLSESSAYKADLLAMLSESNFIFASHSLKKENFNEAIIQINEAINLEPTDPGYLAFRGKCHQELKQYDDAIEDYSEAINISPIYATAYSGRSFVYLMTGEHIKAFSDLNIAIGLDPNNAANFSNRVGIFWELGQIERARKDLIKAIELDPHLEEARNKLSDLLGEQTEEQIERIYQTQLESLTNPAEIDKFFERSIEESKDRITKLRAQSDLWMKGLIVGLIVTWLLLAETSYRNFSLTEFHPWFFVTVSATSAFLIFPLLYFIRRINHDIRIERHVFEDYRRKWIMLRLRNVERGMIEKNTSKIMDHFGRRGTPEKLAELYNPKHARPEQQKYTRPEQDDGRLVSVLERLISAIKGSP